MDTTTFKIELKLEDLQKRVESYLETEISKYVNDSNLSTVLRENISSIFKTSWSDSRGSRLRQIIDERIEDKIRNCIWTILDKTDIASSIEKAIEENLRDGEFLKNLTKAKTMELLTNKNNQ